MRDLHLFFILILFASCSDIETFENSTCINNITTIDAESGLKENQSVIIQDNKIVRIQETKKVNLTGNSTFIDGTGKYLIPGLWDAHIHFAYIEGLAPSMFDLFLAHGVTSVRDTGGKIGFVKKWKDQADADPKNAPRVKIAGPLLDGTPNVYDGSTPSRPVLSVELTDVESAINKVEELDKIGVDLLKAYEMLSPEQFSAIAKIAKEKNLKVTGHVPLSMDVISASNAGLNSMEHLRNLEMSTASNWEELLAIRKKLLAEGKLKEGGVLRSNIHSAQRREAIEKADPEVTKKVLAVLAKNQTWQIPTLSIMTGATHRPFGREDWQASFAYLPDSIGQQWSDGAKSVMKLPPTEDRIKYSNWMNKMVKDLHDAKVEIMAGTDCPIFFLTPGLSLHEELFLLVKAGMSPLEVLKAATLNPAIYFEMEDQIGLVKEGMLADLVLLNDNPLEDIRNTTKIESVFKDGKLFNRSDLDKLFNKLSNQ